METGIADKKQAGRSASVSVKMSIESTKSSLKPRDYIYNIYIQIYIRILLI